MGKPRHTSAVLGAGLKQFYVGDDANAKRAILKLSYPVDRGVITNWEDITSIYRHTFDQELRVDSKEHPLIFTEATLTDMKARKLTREKITQIAFEDLNVPLFYLANSAVCALLASEKTTVNTCALHSEAYVTQCVHVPQGLVLESGGGVTRSVPVYDGHVLYDGVQTLNMGARDLVERMYRLICDAGYSTTGGTVHFASIMTHFLVPLVIPVCLAGSERELYRDIMEKTCYIALDPAVEIKKEASAIGKPYEL